MAWLELVDVADGACVASFALLERIEVEADGGDVCVSAYGRNDSGLPCEVHLTGQCLAQLVAGVSRAVGALSV